VGAGLCPAQVERSSTVEIASYTGQSIVPSSKDNPILGRGIARPHKRVTTQKLVETKVGRSKTVQASFVWGRGFAPPRSSAARRKETDLQPGWTGHSPVPTQELLKQNRAEVQLSADSSPHPKRQSPTLRHVHNIQAAGLARISASGSSGVLYSGAGSQHRTARCHSNAGPYTSYIHPVN
jgi:hypothetical protein